MAVRKHSGAARTTSSLAGEEASEECSALLETSGLLTPLQKKKIAPNVAHIPPGLHCPVRNSIQTNKERGERRERRGTGGRLVLLHTLRR